jgi:hypothetical protein
MPTTSNMISGQETSRVGYGNGGIGIFNSTGQNVGSIILGSHPESFQFEQNGDRIYVNVPKQRGINVVDRKKRAVVPRWLWMTPTKGCSSGADSSLGLVVLDTTSGRIATSLPTVGVTDDIFYDSGRHLVYVIGGEGAVEVLRQHDLDHYQPVRRITPAPGARTGLFVPGFNRRYERVGEPRPALHCLGNYEAKIAASEKPTPPD